MWLGILVGLEDVATIIVGIGKLGYLVKWNHQCHYLNYMFFLWCATFFHWLGICPLLQLPMHVGDITSNEQTSLGEVYLLVSWTNVLLVVLFQGKYNHHFPTTRVLWSHCLIAINWVQPKVALTSFHLQQLLANFNNMSPFIWIDFGQFHYNDISLVWFHHGKFDLLHLTFPCQPTYYMYSYSNPQYYHKA